jgi:alkanesulfonate monooxygenase
MMPLDPGPRGERVDALLAQLEQLSTLGISHTHARLENVAALTPLEIIGEQVIPVAARF